MPIKHYTELRAKPDLTKQTTVKESQRVYSAAAHMCGWRKTMEDADIIEMDIDGQGSSLFAIFDGHGGNGYVRVGGEIAIFAKRHLVPLLTKSKSFQTQNYEAALEAVFQDLDDLMMTSKGSDEVFEIKAELEEQIKKELKAEWVEDSDEEEECLAGSTAIVCLITKASIFLASLGDSRCIIAYNDTFKELSIEHKPDLPEEKARIEAAGGTVKNHRVNGKLGMSRSIGDFQFKLKKNRPKDKQMVITRPHIEQIENKGVEFILMGCDGVWEAHEDVRWYYETVRAQLRENVDRKKMLEDLLDDVVAKDLEGEDGFDNMTAILIVEKLQGNG